MLSDYITGSNVHTHRGCKASSQVINNYMINAFKIKACSCNN